MTKRPTIALAMIVKNERENLPRLFASVKDCFDEIHITDTGSTDGTVEWLQSQEASDVSGSKVFVHYFKWVNDFAAARNASFEPVKTDYILWCDGDDTLHNRSAFIAWRDHAMEFTQYVLATYNYALDKEGKPVVSFARERVFKRSIGPKWNYFVHEGVVPPQGTQVTFATTWAINHMRTDEDIAKDKSRNLMLLEAKENELDARMRFYYGKELYENGKSEKALKWLLDASSDPKCEGHDRMLAIQYACYAAMSEADKLKEEFQQEKIVKVIALAHQGLQMDPARAEYHIICGEAYLKLKNIVGALPHFAAAEHCISNNVSGGVYSGPIFAYKQHYQDYPKIQKAKCYFHLGRIDEAKAEAKSCFEKYGSVEAKMMLEELNTISPLVTLDGKRESVPDIVFTCPPQSAYPFDEELYKTKPMGGSETALIHMSRELKALTGRPVKVFNMRESKMIGDSGVEWLPASTLNEYFAKYSPAVHIAWRHNIKLTNALTYLWAHDLVTQGVEQVRNFDYMLCLSPFHRDFTHGIAGVPLEQIVVTTNGIPVRNFDFWKTEKIVKNPNKLVWASSPDRGLVNCIPVLDLVREKYPDIELHIYYGLENLVKYGLKDKYDAITAMMFTRPWIKLHGFTEQKKMHRDCADAVIWPHTADFVETNCITASEMLADKVYPVTRRLGALKDTLKKAEQGGMATLLDHDAVTPEERRAYADAIIKALDEKAWERVNIDVESHSWHNVAKSWLEFMPIKPEAHGVFSESRPSSLRGGPGDTRLRGLEC
jgi:glycosyltransferase involved in cell wall biosynthesis/tetratricopeptide (TPR) repeat protein